MILSDLCWRLEDLGRAVAALAGENTQALSAPVSPEMVDEWIAWAAGRCGGEASASDIALRDLELLLTKAAPAIFEVDDGYLVVLEAGRKLRVLTPDLAQHRVSSKIIAAAIREPFESDYRASYRKLVASLGVSQAKQEKLLAALLNEQTGVRRFRRAWTFRGIDNQAPIWRGIPRLVVAHTIQYLLWLASWGVLGALTFTGHMDRGWLEAWALLLLTLIPFRLLTTWTQGTFAIGLGALLKRRLLQGALRLEPEEVRAGGVGSFLGQALEAEAIETLAISGGVTGLLAIVEMIPALFVLGRFSIALASWCAVAFFAGWRFFQSYKRWTAKRMDLTNQLVEAMVGHRTRLAQQPRADWHTSEDAALSQYLTLSSNVDHAGSWLVAAIPRGWLLLGLGCIAPSLAAGHALSSETALLLGGVLLAFSAFQRLVASFADIAGAIVGWQRVKPLFDAAARHQTAGEMPPLPKNARKGRQLLEAERLTFRYAGQATPALRGCNIAIQRGEHILLEGPSGGGKTTLASLLSGLRQPESGLLLINGLDRHTLGESAWRKQIAAAPQFHENHVLTETLVFNLLMGRNWPPSNKDLQEAETVCHELGLGDLLARMPGGIMQMVGEGGWQLSHGERSRIFLARALLQQSELVILDESFAALDPENLQVAMETTLRRSETLLVIAHP
jgi:ATP-binding cassette subfamily B protein